MRTSGWVAGYPSVAFSRCFGVIVDRISFVESATRVDHGLLPYLRYVYTRVYGTFVFVHRIVQVALCGAM